MTTAEILERIEQIRLGICMNLANEQVDRQQLCETVETDLRNLLDRAGY